MRVAHGFRSSVVGVATIAAAALALPGAALASPRPHAAAAAVVLPDAHLPAGTHVLGATPASQTVRVSVVLQPRSASALAAYAHAVTDVHSHLFRHYLPRGAFASRFGPTSASIRAVEAFAATSGLHIDGLSSNHLVLTVTGSAARFSSAFSTRLSQVRLPDGEVGRATTAPLRIPAGIAHAVLAVIGLNDLARAHTSLVRVDELRHPTERSVGRSFPTVRPLASPGAPSACSAATDATELGYGGITDDQVAHAYGADGLYSAGDLGAGQTIAIFELEPFLTSDVAAFDQCYFGADHTSNITKVNVDGGPGTGPGGGEAALDVENVSALAPDAKILVYQAPDTNAGSIDAYNQIVSDDRAQVATSSWGYCERDQLNLSPGAMAAENLIFEQAATQGQTVFNASGDSGDDACAYDGGYPTNPVLSVGDPASQDYVVGVGGTTAITVNQPPSEQVWNDGAAGGASTGGISAIWEQPSWMPASADALSSASPCGAHAGEVCRTTPDVSAFADEYTGITIYWYGEWWTIGGTSSSSPIWAAMLALVNASATCASSSSTMNGVGFAAPLLYRVASNPTDYASGFNDVTAGNNDVFGVEHGLYPALPGYDLATGLGSPQLTPAPDAHGPGLAESLCTAAQDGATASIASVTPSSGSAAGGTPFTITGSGFFSGGVSDVASVDFGSSPVSSYTVVSNTKITGTTPSASTPTTATAMNHLTKGTGGVVVTVTTDDKSVAIGPTYHYVVQSGGKDVPTVIQVGPTAGPAAGGTTVRLYGSGFTGATKVTFGGVAASSFKVMSDVQIDAVAPKLAKQSCLAEATAGLGLCQSQVQVTGPGGKSPTVAALKPYAGFLNENGLGEIVVPKNCKCEAYPTITEYDYAKTVSLTSITGTNGKPLIGDPNGGNLAVLHGTGLNVLTFDWVNWGPAGSELTQDPYAFELSKTGTALEVPAFADPNPGPSGDSVPVSLQTAAGTSDTKTFTYASVPVITGLSTGVLPSAGGTTLTITGGGFSKVEEVVFVPFSGADPPVPILKNFTVVNSTTITMPSPSMVPTAYEVVVCDTYSCASGNPNLPDTWTVDVIFPGQTAVTSAEGYPGGAQPIVGPATGGTAFEVQGTNFGPIGDLQVYLYNELGEEVEATGVAAGPAPTDAGATETITAVAPASLGDDAEIYAIVLVGDDGTSAQTATALLDYT